MGGCLQSHKWVIFWTLTHTTHTHAHTHDTHQASDVYTTAITPVDDAGPAKAVALSAAAAASFLAAKG